jgi:hypothetical protein
VDQQVRLTTSVSLEKKEPQLKGRRRVILIAKTTRSLTEDKVEGNLSIIRVRAYAGSLLKIIKKSDRMDLVFLMVFPSPTWPIYFAYRGKIRGWINKVKKSEDRMKCIEDIRKKTITDYLWIKKVIESSETPEHIKCCKKLVDNWSHSTTSIIRDYKCAFYKTSEIKKTIEVYRRSRRELVQQIADKSVSLIHPIEIY